MNIYIFIVFILSLKIIINFVNWMQLKYYKSEYLLFLGGKNNSQKLTESKQKFRSLIENANVDDSHIPYTEWTGYGHYATINASVLRNFPHNDAQIASLTISKIDEAIGVYKSRVFNTINPLYWIQLIIYLPRRVLFNLGYKKNNFFVKLLQCIWWIVSGISAFLYSLYKTEIDTTIKSILDKIIS